jgi:hypothetical protein
MEQLARSAIANALPAQVRRTAQPALTGAFYPGQRARLATRVAGPVFRLPPNAPLVLKLNSLT